MSHRGGAEERISNSKTLKEQTSKTQHRKQLSSVLNTGKITATCIVTFFSIADIKYHDPKQFKEEGVYFSSQFQRFVCIMLAKHSISVRK